MTKFDRLSARYTFEALSAAVLFLAVSYFVQPFLEADRPLAELAGLAALSVLPMALAMWSVVRFFRNVDERERHILATAGAITVMAGVLVAMFLAKLDGVLTVNLNYYAAFLMIFWTGATLIVRWRS
ncbi:hypothetical protein [Roseibium sediminicola]|uniref:Uncharacterized protein n=1 Tax=Roseibium sediminicola TaxID=2933272 RepID=A0ABT0GZN9_9HYPH|nr:hypothetical protein [Roseibium sp. CAU 1639]MCK7614900.1 hypothetical protein [Roseibium sp. CAU 1639]